MRPLVPFLEPGRMTLDAGATGDGASHQHTAAPVFARSARSAGAVVSHTRGAAPWARRPGDPLAGTATGSGPSGSSRSSPSRPACCPWVWPSPSHLPRPDHPAGRAQPEAELLAQAITFTLPASGIVGESLALEGSADSGLPLDYRSETPRSCSIHQAVLELKSEGTCTVTASQAGDDRYAPAADVTASIEVVAPPPAAEPEPPGQAEEKAKPEPPGQTEPEARGQARPPGQARGDSRARPPRQARAARPDRAQASLRPPGRGRGEGQARAARPGRGEGQARAARPGRGEGQARAARPGRGEGQARAARPGRGEGQARAAARPRQAKPEPRRPRPNRKASLRPSE